MPAPIDLMGCVFDRLTVVGLAPHRGRNRMWACLCVCGKTNAVPTTQLRSRRVKSCGCLKDELSAARAKVRNRKHGMKGTPEYAAWHAMLSRCYNPNVKAFHNYGGRGITVCPEWRSDFAAFYRCIGPKPAGADLDRIDNDGNYEPGNVRWTSRAENIRNSRARRVNDAGQFTSEILPTTWGAMRAAP
jgi:hypothetical protein